MMLLLFGDIQMHFANFKADLATVRGLQGKFKEKFTWKQ